MRPVRLLYFGNSIQVLHDLNGQLGFLCTGFPLRHMLKPIHGMNDFLGGNPPISHSPRDGYVCFKTPFLKPGNQFQAEIPRWLLNASFSLNLAASFFDLQSRLANRVQLTTDGFRPYLTAVEDTFGADVDYAMLVKLYGSPRAAEERYSPDEIVNTISIPITGKPKPWNISTSHVERQNLTIRMQLRRFTRLTNGFSKKLENMKAALALHFAHYNFVRVHQTLRVTPAMQGHVTDHLWSMGELLAAVGQAN